MKKVIATTGDGVRGERCLVESFVLRANERWGAPYRGRIGKKGAVDDHSAWRVRGTRIHLRARAMGSRMSELPSGQRRRTEEIRRVLLEVVTEGDTALIGRPRYRDELTSIQDTDPMLVRLERAAEELAETRESNA